MRVMWWVERQVGKSSYKWRKEAAYALEADAEDAAKWFRREFHRPYRVVRVVEA